MCEEPGLLTGLPPILDAGIETLILGSFPAPASLAAQQYYAHRQNQFWRVLAALLDEALADADPADAETQALRRELEELRVQLFAQELGAKGGVSAKKLAQRVQRLRRAP